MYHTVVQLCQLGLVPAVGGTNEVTCDALEAVYVVAAAAGALVHYLLGILIAAIHAAVACVVHRAITDVELVHHVHDVHDCLGVVCSIAVYLHVEDVAAAGQCMVWSLYLSLVQGRALVVHGHVVGVGIVVLVSNAGNDAELLLVILGEAARKTLGRSGQNAVVMLVAVAELQHTVAHVGNDLQAQFLTLLALAMVLAGEGNEALCQTDETNTQCTLVDNGSYGGVG